MIILGSGVIVLLELARMFSRLYKSSKTQPSVNLVFLLAAGGKFNYFGTKKWLESHLDSSSSSELLSDVKFCLCLDTVGNIHTSSKGAEEKEQEESSERAVPSSISSPTPPKRTSSTLGVLPVKIRPCRAPPKKPEQAQIAVF